VAAFIALKRASLHARAFPLVSHGRNVKTVERSGTSNNQPIEEKGGSLETVPSLIFGGKLL
jgi:hypothetical protein